MTTDKHFCNEHRSLQGKKILVTRARDQAGVFAEMLIDRGATVIEFPTIEVIPPATWEELDDAVKAIGTFQWVLFTSANAVHFFMKRFETLGIDVRILDGIHVCAVGPKTAESLQSRGIKVDLVPAEFKAEGALESFRNFEVKGRKFLIPRAKNAREIIPDKLKELGAEVTVVAAYENVKPAADMSRISSLFEKKIDVITFTSSSTVRNFVEIVGQKEYKTLIQEVLLACIGPITARTLEEYGMKTDIMPREYTIPALVEAIAEYYKIKEPKPRTNTDK
jgi:uroporphyrinogen III methyltransferase/synthase